MNGDSGTVAGMTASARIAALKIQKRTVGIATGGSLIVGWRRSLFL